ncbi:unnamed protein product [Symbiodinium sp. CCMP2456]|nr:unnamed protein product [Symbiodinium sp. CCMP2456]
MAALRQRSLKHAIGARWFAAEPRRLRLSLGAGCIPKVDGHKGEDAFFASLPISAFGLADGVGGWADRGVDAGLFSRALLHSAFECMRQRASAMQRPDLPGVALEAFQAVREKSLEGSCTLLLGQLQQDVISLLNLGDCGIMALRPCSILPRFHGGTVKTSMRLIYRSTPMLHRTNMPLQLSAQDPDVSSLTDYFDLVTCATAFLAASWTNPEAKMSEKGHSKQVYSDPPKIDLVWLPCRAPPQAGLTSESASLDLPLNDGATPQRRKASSLHGLSNAAEESLLKAQQQFWCQQLKLHDQIEELKPLYAKLWLKAIDKEETQVAEQLRLETGAAVKTDEGEERKDSGEDETEEDGSDDTEEGDESELSDGELLDAHQGTKWQSASPVDGPLDAAAFEQQRARRDTDASSVLSARDQVFEKLQKILTAKARRKSRRTCNIFLVSPVEGENASLVLPGFSPSEVFGPADVERMKQVRDSPPKQCPGPEGLRMLKELVEEIKKVEAASESASIYMGGASMQAEQA